MAIDVYLQIDGIKGESMDAGHQGWIDRGHIGSDGCRTAEERYGFHRWGTHCRTV
jgi:type VI protein secretion system component Hcp